MFTGIVQGLATVQSVAAAPDNAFKSFQIALPQGKAAGVQIGASVAINGTCLTVTAIDGDVLSFDVMAETLRATSLGGLEVCACVRVCACVCVCVARCLFSALLALLLTQPCARMRPGWPAPSAPARLRHVHLAPHATRTAPEFKPHATTRHHMPPHATTPHATTRHHTTRHHTPPHHTPPRHTTPPTDPPQAGSRVNYERSARVGDEIGGHNVSGHVHTTARIALVQDSPNNRRLVFELADAAWARYVLPKGYIAVDGCSLTVGEVAGATFSVYLIPETLRVTVFGFKRVGDAVNIEVEGQTQAIVDTVERVVAQHLARRGGQQGQQQASLLDAAGAGASDAGGPGAGAAGVQQRQQEAAAAGAAGSS
jgi:riboflavin synthase alpha subunit